MISTDKLKNKEVINISDGRSLGFVYDIEVDLDTVSYTHLDVYKRQAQETDRPMRTLSLFAWSFPQLSATSPLTIQQRKGQTNWPKNLG